MKKTFLKCNTCGNVMEVLNDSGAAVVCCGKEMAVLEPNKTDGALEKHVPSVSIDGEYLDVQVGETVHPMTVDHYIQWIMVSQGNRTQRVDLTPEDEPRARFVIDPDTRPINVYEYCNLHGLWVKEEK